MSRLVREATIAARKASALRYAGANGQSNNQDILHGDMKLLEKRLEDESVRMFLTDPPYAEPDLYGRLAKLRRRSSFPAVSVSPTPNLDGCSKCSTPCESIWTTGGLSLCPTSMSHDTSTTDISEQMEAYRGIRTLAHPLPPEWLGDFLEGGGHDKRFHTWGQPESEARYLVTRLTEPGDIVVDPFCGGGTVPAVCKVSGRKWLATEINKETVAIARKRVAELGGKLRRTG